MADTKRLSGVTAIVASMLTFVFQYSWGSNIVILALLISSVYPLFTHILILTYVEPYRIASIRYLGLRRVSFIQKNIRRSEATVQVSSIARSKVDFRAIKKVFVVQRATR